MNWDTVSFVIGFVASTAVNFAVLAVLNWERGRRKEKLLDQGKIERTMVFEVDDRGKTAYDVLVPKGTDVRSTTEQLGDRVNVDEIPSPIGTVVPLVKPNTDKN
jgi:hypothetical protein